MAAPEVFSQSSLWIAELETAVGDAERALRLRDWEALDTANALQPRLIHGLRNALEAERATASEAQNREMDARIDRIVAVRDDQIYRLRTFREDVRARLIQLTNFRNVARAAAVRVDQKSTFNVTR